MSGSTGAFRARNLKGAPGLKNPEALRVADQLTRRRQAPAFRIGALWMGAFRACRRLRTGLIPARSRLRVPRAEDRAWAEERWSRLEHLTAEDQSLFVDLLLGDERTWALAERLCRASQAAVAEAPDEALRLARLAVGLAEGIPGPESRRRRLRAWCERFVAHAAGNPAGRSGNPRRLDLKAPFLF
jgi:hypothetical protein